MKKFWNWKNKTVTNQETQEQTQERTLFLNGTIAEESWFDDDVTPQLFKEELLSGSGDITVWINSPGGDCVAAAQIYNMLMDYKGSVTVKIDGIAASAASVIAMAGTKVQVSPVSMMMIHNPATIAFGDTAEMEKAINMLSEVKESIINAYEIKTGLGNAEEDAFLNGSGVGQPLGLFAETGGGTVAKTVTTLTADDIINLIYALKRGYRKDASFIVNDQTIAVIRTFKDNNGAYMWQPSLQQGEPDKLLGYPVHTSQFAPADAIAFGDYSYYNIGDRGTRSFKQLVELFAGNSQDCKQIRDNRGAVLWGGTAYLTD